MDRDSEDLLQRIELNLRLGKLDSLFLIIPTLFGIAYALLQYYFKTVGEIWIITLIPILIVSVGYPIYIGYYRGAIKLNSILERARGWIYMANGFVIYTLFITRRIVGQNTVLYIPLAIITLPSYFFIVRIFAPWLGHSILSLFDKKYSERDRSIFAETGTAAGTLTISLYLIVNIQLLARESYWIAFYIIGMAISFLIFHMYLEYTSLRKRVMNSFNYS